MWLGKVELLKTCDRTKLDSLITYLEDQGLKLSKEGKKVAEILFLLYEEARAQAQKLVGITNALLAEVYGGIYDAPGPEFSVRPLHLSLGLRKKDASRTFSSKTTAKAVERWKKKPPQEPLDLTIYGPHFLGSVLRFIKKWYKAERDKLPSKLVEWLDEQGKLLRQRGRINVSDVDIVGAYIRGVTAEALHVLRAYNRYAQEVVGGFSREVSQEYGFGVVPLDTVTSATGTFVARFPGKEGYRHVPESKIQSDVGTVLIKKLVEFVAGAGGDDVTISLRDVAQFLEGRYGVTPEALDLLAREELVPESAASALAAAGIREFITTLEQVWDMNDKSSSPHMKKFRQNLAKALNDAAQKALENGVGQVSMGLETDDGVPLGKYKLYSVDAICLTTPWEFPPADIQSMGVRQRLHKFAIFELSRVVGDQETDKFKVAVPLDREGKPDALSIVSLLSLGHFTVWQAGARLAVVLESATASGQESEEQQERERFLKLAHVMANMRTFWEELLLEAAQISRVEQGLIARQ